MTSSYLDGQLDDHEGPEGWSPADQPYSIASTETWWWHQAVRLTIARLRARDLKGIGTDQIDARHLLLDLSQLATAARLQATALERESDGLDPGVAAAFNVAQQRFLEALPGLKEMRDGLVHVNEWALGEGRSGPQRELRKSGEAERDVARRFWGLAFDPQAETVTVGQHRPIDLAVAERAASFPTGCNRRRRSAAHPVHHAWPWRKTSTTKCPFSGSTWAAPPGCDSTQDSSSPTMIS